MAIIIVHGELKAGQTPQFDQNWKKMDSALEPPAQHRCAFPGCTRAGVELCTACEVFAFCSTAHRDGEWVRKTSLHRAICATPEAVSGCNGVRGLAGAHSNSGIDVMFMDSAECAGIACPLCFGALNEAPLASLVPSLNVLMPVRTLLGQELRPVSAAYKIDTSQAQPKPLAPLQVFHSACLLSGLQPSSNHRLLVRTLCELTSTIVPFVMRDITYGGGQELNEYLSAFYLQATVLGGDEVHQRESIPLCASVEWNSVFQRLMVRLTASEDAVVRFIANMPAAVFSTRLRFELVCSVAGRLCAIDLPPLADVMVSACLTGAYTEGQYELVHDQPSVGLSARVTRASELFGSTRALFELSRFALLCGVDWLVHHGRLAAK